MGAAFTSQGAQVTVVREHGGRGTNHKNAVFVRIAELVIHTCIRGFGLALRLQGVGISHRRPCLCLLLFRLEHALQLRARPRPVLLTHLQQHQLPIKQIGLLQCVPGGQNVLRKQRQEHPERSG